MPDILDLAETCAREGVSFSLAAGCRLTRREVLVLKRLAEGGSNRQIAQRLFVSENTVKFHLKNIYGKLRICNRTQALLIPGLFVD